MESYLKQIAGAALDYEIDMFYSRTIPPWRQNQIAERSQRGADKRLVNAFIALDMQTDVSYLKERIYNILINYVRPFGLSDSKIPELMRKRLISELTNFVNTTMQEIDEFLSSENIIATPREEIESELDEIFNKRSNSIEAAVERHYAQFTQYMLLKNMEAHGVAGFKFIVGGADNNCETCLAHKDKVYTADELSAFAFFPPLHPNCGCYIELPFEDSEQDRIPWYQWILREYSDKDENAIQKFGKKNIAGGLLNFVGLLFDFPKSLVMNAGLFVVDITHGSMPKYYGDRISLRDFDEITSEKYGKRGIFEILDEWAETGVAGSITANLLETVLELVTDPIFLFSMNQAATNSAVSTTGTPAYNEALSSGKIIDSAELYWRKYLSGNSTDDLANAVQGAGKLPKTTAESVRIKLDTYLLESSHPTGGSKANWFKQALGFDKRNADLLASQIQFDIKTAIKTATTEFGTKFTQTIAIKGANGRIIDVEFVWIRNNDGIVRLITGIPTKP